MPQSKEVHKEYMRRRREGSQEGSQNGGSQEGSQDVTLIYNEEDVTVSPESVTQYPAILYALADPEKRIKLEKICQSLKDHHVLKEVRYGVAGPSMDTVAEFLTAFT